MGPGAQESSQQVDSGDFLKCSFAPYANSVRRRRKLASSEDPSSTKGAQAISAESLRSRGL